MLNLFTEVKSGEGLTAILLTLNVFLILAAYLIAKVVREPLILAGGGAELKSYSATGQGLLLMGAVPLYSMLVARFPRKQLINYVTLFFIACFVLFYLLARIGIPFLGVIFFLWVGIFSLMIIAQFWSFANDIYTPEEGKRLFVIVAFGASAGGVLGPLIAGRLIDVIGIYELLLVSAGILALSLIITNFVDSREREKAREVAIIKAAKTEEKIEKGDAFKVIFRNKYLLMIAFLLLFTNWVNTTGEYILGRGVTERVAQLTAAGGAGFSGSEYIAKFYADFYTIVGFAGLLLQLFLVSRIIKYLGIRFAIMMLPAIALGGYFLIALFPVLNIVRWPKICENATDYSLNNTVRHILFLPTTREEKYKAKVAIDSFFVRTGDVLSSLVVYVGTGWLALELSQFAMINMVLCLGWLFLAYAIGQRNVKLSTKNATVTPTTF